MYPQFVPHARPIYNGTANTALSIGTAVSMSAGKFVPITQDTDIWVGVATADIRANDGNATIALRGGGQVITVKLGSACIAGNALYVTGSTATFVTDASTQVTFTISGSVNGTFAQLLPVAGWALQAGSAGDLIEVVLQ